MVGRLRLVVLGTCLITLLAACAQSSGASAALTGTWYLLSLHNKPLVAGSTITLKLAGERATGDSGCNSYGGKLSTTGEQLDISDIVSTLIACVDSAKMKQEADYLSTLDKVSIFEITEGKLTLKSADGTPQLVFSKTAP